LRGKADYALWAAASEIVRLKLNYRPVGKATETRPMPVTVRGPSGKVVAQAKIQLNQETMLEFQTAEAGVCRVSCEPDSHTVTVSASTRPLWVVSESGVFHFVHTTADFYLPTPSSAADFGVRVTGGGRTELVKATLFDPLGQAVWMEDANPKPRSYVAAAGRSRAGGIWKLHMEKPSQGVFEDHFVEIRGIPPILTFQPMSPGK
jgi:hypothetical protein